MEGWGRRGPCGGGGGPVVEKLCEGEMGAGSDTLLIVRLGLEELTNSYRASS